MNQATRVRTLLTLSLPLAATQLAQHALGAIDTAFAGRSGPIDLAAVGLGASIFVAISHVGLGVVLGCESLTAQAMGRNDKDEAYKAMLHGIWVALAVSIPCVIVIGVVANALPYLGVEAELARETSRYLLGRLASVPLYLIAVACRTLLYAQHKTRPIVVGVLISLVVNVLADAALIGPFGAGGIGFASTVATLAMTGVFVRSVVHETRAYAAMSWSPLLFRRVTVIGLPIGLQLLAEIGVFTVVSILMARIGAEVGGAHLVALSFASMTFAVTLGIGMATSVQVGRSYGAGDIDGARGYGTAGLLLGTVFMGATAIVMWVMPGTLVSLMTNDDAVAKLATLFLGVAAVFQIVDGIQSVANGALRGLGRTQVAFAMNAISHWGVGLPVGLTLAGVMGPVGLWWGLSFGLFFTAIGLTYWFYRCLRYIHEEVYQPTEALGDVSKLNELVGAELSAELGGASVDRLVGWSRQIPRQRFEKLYDAAAENAEVTTAELIPADVPAMQPVQHVGINTLPAFRLFEKVMYRIDQVGIGGRNVQALSGVTGHGYFTINSDNAIDYRQLPENKPNGWPRICENNGPVSRLVYGGMVDTLRILGPGVLIGAAVRDGKRLGQYFVLVRLPPSTQNNES